MNFAAVDAGDFVIGWTSTAQDGSSYGVFAQRFANLATSTRSSPPCWTSTTTGTTRSPTASWCCATPFGFSDATLISGAVGAGCMRCTAPDLESYLNEPAHE